MKQAVIIIHGIGEKRPMETLRSFVKNIYHEEIIDENNFYSKPDTLSRLLELRRLRIKGSRRTPTTDFYEFYWAHHMNNKNYRSILDWLKSFFFILPNKVDSKLLPFYFIGWILIISTIFLMFFSKVSLKMSLGASIILNFLFFKYIIGYVGDAAKYLNPSPNNIVQRNTIREDLLKLLKDLHESKKYTKIIIVGHSLGSVIAYDAIQLYWSKYLTHEPIGLNKQVIEEFKRNTKDIFDDASTSPDKKKHRYQEIQYKLGKELRSVEFPWLVSDFISLGSPLTHRILLEKKKNDFLEKKRLGEYSVCPPYYKEKEWIYYETKGKNATIHFKSNAVFSCVRWTNIYFPHKYFFLGDFIGGPLSRNFGKGIRDLDVSLNGWTEKIWRCHILYWQKSKSLKNKKNPVRVLKNFMRL